MGKYIEYDFDCEMFINAVQDEMLYQNRNFRVEASGKGFVEFWPLKCVEPLINEIQTWGDQY